MAAIHAAVMPRDDSAVAPVWPLCAIRTALFAIQRRWHHRGESPAEGSPQHAHALSALEAVREQLLAGQRPP